MDALHEALAQVVAKINGRDVTRGELRQAFERVSHPNNWKLGINRVVDLNNWEMELISEAVIFFTGSAPEFFPMVGATFPKNRYRVVAAGYYAAVGA